MRLVKRLEKQNIKIMSELKEQRREIQILRRGLSAVRGTLGHCSW